MEDKGSSASFQIIEKIEVIQEVVLSDVSKLNDSVANKKTRRLNTEKTKNNSSFESSPRHKYQLIDRVIQ